jgi:hypothetical protein
MRYTVRAGIRTATAVAVVLQVCPLALDLLRG